MYNVYSDGASKGNPGPSGWGALVVGPDGSRKEYFAGVLNATNQQMELQGAIEGLRGTPEGATVRMTLDSQYVIKGMTEWIHGWVRKDWVSSTGGAVKNKELWQELHGLVKKRTIAWQWVKGHNGHPENERCDELANQGVASLGVSTAKPDSIVFSKNKDGGATLVTDSSTFWAYSDGGCRKNGLGGWAALVVQNGKEVSSKTGVVENVTNNKMELEGAIAALMLTPEGSNTVLTTDSQYVVKGMTEWLQGWKSRGWRSAAGEEVKNQALWVRLESEASKRTVQWQWVRGHNDHPENERCDALLNEAMDEYKNKNLLQPIHSDGCNDLGVFEI